MQNRSLDELTCTILLNRLPVAVRLRFEPLLDELLALRVFCNKQRRVDVVDSQ
jgi:hypothetical protein